MTVCVRDCRNICQQYLVERPGLECKTKPLKGRLQTAYGWRWMPDVVPEYPHQLCWSIIITIPNTHADCSHRGAYLQMSNTLNLDVRPHGQFLDCDASTALWLRCP